MRVAMVYRGQSEQERPALDFAKEFKKQTGRHVDMNDVNTRDGWATAQLYDVVKYPAIVIIEDNGIIFKTWQGDNLPPLSEVIYYCQK